MKIAIGKDIELIEQAQAIRHQVFTLEQKIPQELDFDGLDEVSFHALVTVQGEPVATARLTINEDGSSVMARVAVIKPYRGLGIASKVVKTILGHAQSFGVQTIKIHAHSYLRSYYEKLGFKFIQKAGYIGGHQLIEMQCQLVRSGTP